VILAIAFLELSNNICYKGIFMPAPLMHIALAFIALEGPFSHTSKKDFIVGTSFPDIRYLKVIDRKQTHENYVSWDQVNQDKNGFKLGYLFHSWVDLIFDEFMQNNNIYEKLPKSTYTTQGFKFFADKMIYNKIKTSLTQIVHYFDDVSNEELSFGIEKDAVIKWHKFLKQYCIHGDLCLTAQRYAFLPNSSLETIGTTIAKMDEQNNPAKKLVDDFYDFACKKIKEIKLLKTKDQH
jgi:hypothetical protein